MLGRHPGRGSRDGAMAQCNTVPTSDRMILSDRYVRIALLGLNSRRIEDEDEWAICIRTADHMDIRDRLRGCRMAVAAPQPDRQGRSESGCGRALVASQRGR